MTAVTEPKHTPDEKIVITAKAWRRRDSEAIHAKADPTKQRAEYRARQQLRKVIDDAGRKP